MQINSRCSSERRLMTRILLFCERVALRTGPSRISKSVAIRRMGSVRMLARVLQTGLPRMTIACIKRTSLARKPTRMSALKIPKIRTIKHWTLPSLLQLICKKVKLWPTVQHRSSKILCKSHSKQTNITSSLIGNLIKVRQSLNSLKKRSQITSFTLSM